MDSIIFSRLKSYLTRKLEIAPEASIVVSDVNLVTVLAHVCEFVEQQKHIELSGNEKKELALTYYKRVVLENLNADGFAKLYPDLEVAHAKHGEFVANVQLFLEKYAPSIVDGLIRATKGAYVINVNQKKPKK